MTDKQFYINGRKELSAYALSCGYKQVKKINGKEISLQCESPSAQVYRVIVDLHSTWGSLGAMRRLWREEVKKAEAVCASI